MPLTVKTFEKIQRRKHKIFVFGIFAHVTILFHVKCIDRSSSKVSWGISYRGRPGVLEATVGHENEYMNILQIGLNEYFADWIELNILQIGLN